MPVKRHASGTRMLMGSIASGDDGGRTGGCNGITALSLDNGDGWKDCRPAALDYSELYCAVPHDVCTPMPVFLRPEVKTGTSRCSGWRRTTPALQVSARILDVGRVGQRISPGGQHVIPAPVQSLRFARGRSAQPRNVAEYCHFAETMQR